jgi:transcriptional antiterminator RfaH
MVRFGGVPAVVPDELIASLNANADSNGLQKLIKKNISPGDRIEIIAGPFAGYEGIYHQQKTADRVAILLDVVGKNAALTLSSHDLQLATTH